MPATLHVIFGPCGAGKTTYARALARREGAVPFVLDDWGARLFGPDVTGPLDFTWMRERLGRCSAQIWLTATDILAVGTPVVLDIGAMRRADRDRVRQQAQGLSLQWHFVDAPQDVRRARVTDRNTARGETFVREVSPEMFDLLEQLYEAPDPSELEGAILPAPEMVPAVHTIVTHPGGAHKDDLLAACVLAALHDCPIERREPTRADLDDPDVAVVDIGGAHDPARSNFDHHHFPREHPPTCALSLVLAHLGLYEDARQFCDWLETAEWFDSRGPKKTGDWLNVPRRAISQLNSPIDMTLLRRFSQATRLEPTDPLYLFMKMVGADLLTYLRDARERLDFIEGHVQRWNIPAGPDTIETLYLPRTDASPDEPSAMLGSFIRAKQLDTTIAAIIYPDRRGGGYGIGRYEDHPSLDFSRVEHEPDVHFAHKSGFMCKTTATDPARLQQLVALAWKPR